MAKRKRVVEFVGGPLCGAKREVSNLEPHTLVFLASANLDNRPFVHVYHTLGYGEDFLYQHARDYSRTDAGGIAGRVP